MGKEKGLEVGKVEAGGLKRKAGSIGVEEMQRSEIGKRSKWSKTMWKCVHQFRKEFPKQQEQRGMRILLLNMKNH